MTRTVGSILVALAIACGGNKPAHEDTATPKQASKPALELPADGATVRIVQRTAVDMPGSAGAYTIAIDDITGGQVGLTLGRKDGGGVLVSKSVHPNEVVPFTIDEHRYEVVVEELFNELVGDDVAVLLVRAAAGDAPEAKATRSEPQRIEALIDAVAASGIVFIRNGSEHSASEAADHLRTKYSRAGDRVKTAEQFIDVLGSTSSQSGEPYRVRLPDGTERDAGPWLHERLRDLDASN